MSDQMHGAENGLPTERFLAWDAATLDRAAEHGCLDESIETGDPLVCGACCPIPPATTPEETK